jgi:hypothetical protein
MRRASMPLVRPQILRWYLTAMEQCALHLPQHQATIQGDHQHLR